MSAEPDPDRQHVPAPRWASLQVAAQYLGVGQRTLYRYAAAGRIPSYRFGPRLIRFDLNEVDAAAKPILARDGEVG